MANNPYSKQQVLDIIEREADERGIPRDDFLRFAYIETGGAFDPTVSRGAAGAKGLFQFVPGTARQYGIAGQELDPVANTDAAARLYLDNRRSLVNEHDRSHRPYLSGEEQPNGLDMYLAHQQGAAGYKSIQNAIATGSFSLDNTRAHILNNVYMGEVQRITGVGAEQFRQMGDADMARTFVSYWDAKYERIRIPEKGIEPLTTSAQQQSTQTRTQTQAQPQQAQSQQASPAQTSSPAMGAALMGAGVGAAMANANTINASVNAALAGAQQTQGGIALETAYQQSLQYDHVRYSYGEKNINTGAIDCSGWVVRLQNATMDEVNRKAGTSVFSPEDKFSSGWHNAAKLVELSQERSGVMIRNGDITPDVLREGMIIGEDQPGSARGIDHIVMVVRNPNNGQLMISQSRSGEGVELTSVQQYLDRKLGRGVELYATDPLAQARNLLQDRSQTQTQGHQQSQGSSAATPARADNGMLQQGSTGTDVKRLQETMNQLGYRDSEGKSLGTDGVFGSRTEQAVRAFQKAHGIGVDGVVGPDTRAAIGQAQQNHGRSANADLLKQGSHGPAVQQLQEALNRHGFRDAEGKPLSTDGVFGDRTQQAVEALQKTYGVGVDGKVGPDTRGALAQAQQHPLLTDSRHPDHALQQQAYDGLKRLDPAKLQFGSELEYRNAASTTAFEAKVSGITRIDSIMLNRDGTGLAAIQGALGDPGSPRVYVDRAQAMSQSLERSTTLMDQETQRQTNSRNQEQQLSNQQTPRSMYV